MPALGIFLSIARKIGAAAVASYFTYRRPGGVNTYLRPDGTSHYKRP